MKKKKKYHPPRLDPWTPQFFGLRTLTSLVSVNGIFLKLFCWNFVSRHHVCIPLPVDHLVVEKRLNCVIYNWKIKSYCLFIHDLNSTVIKRFNWACSLTGFNPLCNNREEKKTRGEQPYWAIAQFNCCRLSFSWPFSLISFSPFTFPGAPYRIFLLYVPRLTCSRQRLVFFEFMPNTLT